MLTEGLSVVLPAFNEEGNIGETLSECLQQLPSLAPAFEIIVVDDGSRDGTAEVVRGRREGGERVRLVRHAENRGYGAALRSGFSEASHPWILFMDSDGQFRMADAPLLLDHPKGQAMVAGIRGHRSDPPGRVWMGKLFTAINRWVFHIPLKDLNCGFKLLRTEVVRSLSLETSGALLNAELAGKIARRGLSWTERVVPHYPRRAGNQTGMTLKVVGRAIRDYWGLWRILRAFR